MIKCFWIFGILFFNKYKGIKWLVVLDWFFFLINVGMIKVCDDCIDLDFLLMKILWNFKIVNVFFFLIVCEFLFLVVGE